MMHTVECFNEETECNDPRLLLKTLQNSWEYPNSTNLNTNLNESNNNFHKPQNVIYSNDKTSDLKFNMNFMKKMLEALEEKSDAQINFDELDEKEQFQYLYEWLQKNSKNLPQSLIPITIGSAIPVCEEGFGSELPPWYDHNKFLRGQQFARDYIFGIFFAGELGLFTLFSFEDGLKPLIFTEKSSEPYTAFTRYLSTANRLRNWYSSDPWTKGTAAYNDIKVVRRKHQQVRDKLENLSNSEIDQKAKIDNCWSSQREILLKDFRLECPAARLGQTPYADSRVRELRMNKLNQCDMAATQFGFFGLVILFPKAFGIYSATDEDLEAFCHVWRGLAYLLGVKDEYNFCSGSFDEIKQRAKDFLEFWVKPNLRNVTPEWEHMSRCVTAGMEYYFPGMPYEASLLYLMELMSLEMPQFRTSMSAYAKFRHSLTKFVLKYPYRVLSIREHLNAKLHHCMDRALNFDEEKHRKLREKSMSTMLNHSRRYRDSISATGKSLENKSTGIETKYLQYKIIGVLMVVAQCLILWRVTPISGLL